MIVPFLLLLLSLSGIGAALTVPGLSDLVLVAGPCAIASLYLLLRAYFGGKTDRWPKVLRKAAPLPKAQRWVIIDGSNVMHWKDGPPQIETVREVVARLKAMGFSPGVVFDANAGHILTGKYQHHYGMGKLLGLPEDRVMVVHKGSPADVTILAAAKDLGARVVTNDRYRDWAETHPEVRAPGYLIKGGYRAGELWFDL